MAVLHAIISTEGHALFVLLRFCRYIHWHIRTPIIAFLRLRLDYSRRRGLGSHARGSLTCNGRVVQGLCAVGVGAAFVAHVSESEFQDKLKTPSLTEDQCRWGTGFLRVTSMFLLSSPKVPVIPVALTDSRFVVSGSRSCQPLGCGSVFPFTMQIGVSHGGRVLLREALTFLQDYSRCTWIEIQIRRVTKLKLKPEDETSSPGT